MKKTILILAIPLLILFGFLLFSTNKPSSSSVTKIDTPRSPILSNSPTILPSTCNALTLVSPIVNQTVKTPLLVSVVIDNTDKNCHWTVFEAQAGMMKLTDETKSVIGTGILSTKESWMTDQPVTYSGTIIFDKKPEGKTLDLQIQEENPSGKPGAQTLSFPLYY